MNDRKPSPLAGVELARPLSYAERLDIRTALAGAEGTAEELRVLASAIGLCSGRIRRRLPYKGRIYQYGGQVLDKLMGEYGAAGWPEEDALAELGAKGTEAVKLCAYPTKGAVEEALGNSEAPAGA